MEGINGLIDKYSKNKNIDLSKIVIPDIVHLKTYEKQGQEARSYYLKYNSK